MHEHFWHLCSDEPNRTKADFPLSPIETPQKCSADAGVVAQSLPLHHPSPQRIPGTRDGRKLVPPPSLDWTTNLASGHPTVVSPEVAGALSTGGESGNDTPLFVVLPCVKQVPSVDSTGSASRERGVAALP
ncbi:hypothetical protein JDV02_000677 [Purpureocillium takamizusanense]|uniref:Uncharacterized protein n=1 Tax=Purpureocillium takamizusanense TaxID=2060973 RepID=A0A9Q8Q7T4_9HYPO|nr:uncharacterized protein JDV02_000677 [Purpureocillium takamizusanense]UNI13993.1 hypothetical protein JDV02_000677 [Purpureocillium takamizusanense]